VNRILIAAALASFVCMPQAHAAFVCNNPVQTFGDPGDNPAVLSKVGIDPATKHWWASHTLRDGTVKNRDEQYQMIDASDATHFRWQGRSLEHKDLFIIGTVFADGVGGATYIEALYNSKTQKLLGELTGKCLVDNTVSLPVVAQSPVISAPATTQFAAPQAPDRVPFTYAGGEMHVPVALSGYPVTMVVDTGATTMTVTETVANSLVDQGRAAFTGDVATVTLADSSTRREREISINSLTVGNHTIQNVIAHVAPDGSEMLLGHLVLARLAPKFGINVASSSLEFN
jgi:hypothetical protein